MQADFQPKPFASSGGFSYDEAIGIPALTHVALRRPMQLPSRPLSFAAMVVASAVAFLLCGPTTAKAETIAGTDVGWPYDADTSSKEDIGKSEVISTPDVADSSPLDVWSADDAWSEWPFPNSCWYESCYEYGAVCAKTEGCKEMLLDTDFANKSWVVSKYPKPALLAFGNFVQCAATLCNSAMKDTCVDRCGLLTSLDGACQCDTACSGRGDCCEDYKSKCEAQDTDADMTAETASDVQEPEVWYESCIVEFELDVGGGLDVGADAADTTGIGAVEFEAPFIPPASPAPDGCSTRRVSGAGTWAWLWLAAIGIGWTRRRGWMDSLAK